MSRQHEFMFSLFHLRGSKRCAVLGVAAAMAWLPAADAANLTWNGGESGVWKVGGTGWNGGTWANEHRADFLGATPHTVTIDDVNGAVGCVNLYVRGAAYTFTGDALTNAGTTLLGTNADSSGSVTQQCDYTSTRNADNVFTLGYGNNSMGSWTVESGALTAVAMPDNQNYVNIGYAAGSTGTLDIDGGAAYFRAVTLGRSANASTGTIKLQSGTLAIYKLVTANTNGTHKFELSGGTLRPYDNTLTIGSATAANNDFDFILTGTGATITTQDAVDGTPRTVDIYSDIKESGSRQGLTFTANSDATAINLRGANTYSGTTTVGQVQIKLLNANALGGTTLDWTGSGAMQFDSSVAGKVFTFGGLMGDKDLALKNNAATPAAIALTVGGNSDSTTYSGKLTDAGSLIKVGSGTLTLSGDNTYSGGTIISNGMLAVDGSLSAIGAVTVAAGGALGGSGMIGGEVSVKDGGMLTPGATSSADVLSVSSNVTFEAGAVLKVNLNGPTVETDYDRLVVTGGTLQIDGVTLSVAVGPDYSPLSGAVFEIVRSDDPIQGAFDGLADGDKFQPDGSPVVFVIRYDNASNPKKITLTARTLNGTLIRVF